MSLLQAHLDRAAAPANLLAKLPPQTVATVGRLSRRCFTKFEPLTAHEEHPRVERAALGAMPGPQKALCAALQYAPGPEAGRIRARLVRSEKRSPEAALEPLGVRSLRGAEYA